MIRARAYGLRCWLAQMLVLALCSGAWAQTVDAPATDAPPTNAAPQSGTPKVAAPKTGGTGQGISKSGKSISITPNDPNVIDYAAWDLMATRAETALTNSATSNAGLELVRVQLVEWRARLQVAQNANGSRIATVRTQITSLGPAPAEGATEPDELAARRKTLGDQLARLQAPGMAADEAYTRADSLIREIDTALRNRQADELLRLWPMPMNPANWPDALGKISTAALGLVDETTKAATRPQALPALKDNLPAILLLLGLAAALILRGRLWCEGLTDRLHANAGARGRKIWAFIASLGQIVMPVAGVMALSQAALQSGLFGATGVAILRELPGMAILIFTAGWLGGRIFPKSDTADAPLTLPPERRAEGRFLFFLMGIVLPIEVLRAAIFDVNRVGEAAVALLTLPLLVLAGVALVRLGGLLRRHAKAGNSATGEQGFRDRMISIFGMVFRVIGLVGPVLAAVGYIGAALALVFPMVLSIGLLAVLFTLNRLIEDIYRAIVGDSDDAQGGLLPVLLAFGVVLASTPLFALIWGARREDLLELWTRFGAGFQLGATRISPTDFLKVAVLFAIGYTITRLLQAGLKTTVLPRTSLDTGGKNAILAGLGYTGVFLSALIAINAVGIDLSGLAIVAGALSVGIGFGLQNIVSNFVSGIILLIERPVSEGDWIEVGGVQGIVKGISVRSTRIQTFDRSDVIVPNADLVSGQVTNWTRFSLSGRLIVAVGVDYGSDTRKVEAILQEIAEAQPMAILNPPPMVAFMGLGADALNFEIRMILRDVNFSLSVRSEINHAIIGRFRAEGIAMPFSQRDIWLRNPEALAEAMRPQRRRPVADESPAPEAAPEVMPRTGSGTNTPAPSKRKDPEEPTL